MTTSPLRGPRSRSSDLPPSPADAPSGPPRGRHQFAVFGITVSALVLPAVAIAVANGADLGALDSAPPVAQLALFAQALVPAIAALTVWAVTRRPPAWGFRRFPVRTVGLAWLIGVVAAGAVYPIAWATGLAGFDPDALTASTGLPALATAAIGLVPGVVPYVLLAIGEQLGWSSFLAVRLSERRSRDVTALTVGSAWAAFHVPMMLFVPGAIDEGVPAALAVAMFLLQCLALAFPMVWLRLRTGSIWPVLVLHAALNATLYFVVEPATVVSESTHLLLGEGGMLTTAGVVAAVLLTLPLWRKAGVTEKRG